MKRLRYWPMLRKSWTRNKFPRAAGLALALLFVRDRLQCVDLCACEPEQGAAAEHHHDSDSSQCPPHDDSHCLALISPSAQPALTTPHLSFQSVFSIVGLLPQSTMVASRTTWVWDHGPPGASPPAIFLSSALSERAPPVVV